MVKVGCAPLTLFLPIILAPVFGAVHLWPATLLFLLHVFPFANFPFYVCYPTKFPCVLCRRAIAPRKTDLMNGWEEDSFRIAAYCFDYQNGDGCSTDYDRPRLSGIPTSSQLTKDFLRLQSLSQTKQIASAATVSRWWRRGGFRRSRSALRSGTLAGLKSPLNS